MVIGNKHSLIYYQPPDYNWVNEENQGYSKRDAEQAVYRIGKKLSLAGAKAYLYASALAERSNL